MRYAFEGLESWGTVKRTKASAFAQALRFGIRTRACGVFSSFAIVDRASLFKCYAFEGLESWGTVKRTKASAFAEAFVRLVHLQGFEPGTH